MASFAQTKHHHSSATSTKIATMPPAATTSTQDQANKDRTIERLQAELRAWRKSTQENEARILKSEDETFQELLAARREKRALEDKIAQTEDDHLMEKQSLEAKIFQTADNHLKEKRNLEGQLEETTLERNSLEVTIFSANDQISDLKKQNRRARDQNACQREDNERNVSSMNWMESGAIFDASKRRSLEAKVHRLEN